MSAKRLMWFVAIPVMAVVLVVAIIVNNVTPDDDADARQDPASWTFMAYVMGDTNLEPYALDDLAEMASVGSSDDLNIVAMVDRSPDYSDDGIANLPDWEDTKLLEVQQDEFVQIDDLGELNTGESDTLATFVETAIAMYPADNYALLLWDHGGGWLGMGADETNGDDGLELDEISEGIGTGLAAAGVDKLDLLGFDACLMATFEVASTLSQHADYLVASEEVEPGHGWNYGQLQVVADEPQIAAPDLARAMIDGYQAQAEAEGTESDITLGLLDLTAVDDLVSAMDDVAEAFVADPIAYSPDLAAAQNDVLEFGRDPDPENSTYQIDLGGFLGNLAAEEGEIAERATVALDALNATVLEHIAGPATSDSTGMSIYFPPTESLFYEDYLNLAGVPAWPAMLAEYFASGALLAKEDGASFHETLEATATADDGVLEVFAPLTAAGSDSVVESSAAIGFEHDGELVYAFEMPASVGTDEDGTIGVAAEYDLTYLTIGDGMTDELAYQSVGIDPGTGLTVIDIPVDYVAPGKDPDLSDDGLVSIVIDEDGTILEEDFYARDASGSLGAFDPDPDGMLFPVALVLTDGGDWAYERTGTDGIAADLDGLEYTLHDVPSGTELTIELFVTDFAGESDYTVVTATAP